MIGTTYLVSALFTCISNSLFTFYFIGIVQWGINTTVHATTHEMPYKVVFGQDPHFQLVNPAALAFDTKAIERRGKLKILTRLVVITRLAVYVTRKCLYRKRLLRTLTRLTLITRLAVFATRRCLYRKRRKRLLSTLTRLTLITRLAVFATRKGLAARSRFVGSRKRAAAGQALNAERMIRQTSKRARVHLFQEGSPVGVSIPKDLRNALDNKFLPGRIREKRGLHMYQVETWFGVLSSLFKASDMCVLDEFLVEGAAREHTFPSCEVSLNHAVRCYSVVLCKRHACSCKGECGSRCGCKKAERICTNSCKCPCSTCGNRGER